jgi:ligand-binding sensor domain-containing protein/signal transduction histidine kinase
MRQRGASLLLAATMLSILLLTLCGPAFTASPASAMAATARWSQLADPVFQHLGTVQGLPHVMVTSLVQDREGFLWAGTQDGLARWDGYRFRTLVPDARNGFSIPDNYIQTLHLDQRSRLWVGTGGNGLARYDAQQDHFVRIPVGEKGISHVAVLALADDGANGLWVGSLGGLDHLNANGVADGHWHAGDNGLSSDEVRTLMLDVRGRLWLGTRKGLLLYDAGRFVAIPLPGVDSQPFVRSLLEGSDGRIWIGTASHGAFVLDVASMQARALPDDAANGVHLSRDVVTSICEVRPGHIWFGTVGHGIVTLDSASLQMRRLEHDPLLAASVADNSVLALRLDRSGLLWVATQRGISWHDPDQGAILSLFGGAARSGGIADIDVTAVATLPDGRIRLGLHGGGVQTIDAGANRIETLSPDARHPDTALPALPVHGFATLDDGTQYIASGRGLYRVDLAGGAVQYQRFPPMDEGKAVSAVLMAGKQLVVGVEGGVWLIDKQTRQAQRMPDLDSLKRETIIMLAQDGHGRLWIGTRNSGLYRLDPKSRQLRHMAANRLDLNALSAGNIASLLFDRRGRMWIATQGGGINMVSNPDDDGPFRFVRFGTQDGLPNALVNKLLEDERGNIWASTDAGLAVVDGNSLKVHALTRADGVMIDGYWSNSGAISAQGELMFGGTGGMTVVRPGLLKPWDFRPPVVITELRVGGKPVVASRFNLSGSGGAVLEITPQANSIAVEFAALDFSAPEQNRYAWQLEGYDRDWIETDFAHRLAAYTNLPPGEYRLRLRGSNRNGVWSPQERSLALRVLPSWQQSWWFWLLQALALSAVVLALVQGRTRYLRHRQHELESMVQTRTTQLQQAQEQLVQQEKLASLGGLVVGIAHEINTPLGTTMMAISGAQDCWQRLREAQAGGRLSQSLLDMHTSEGLEYTELASRTAARAAELITSFKAIAVQFESDNLVTLDLAAYLPEVAMLVRPSLEQSGHRLEIEVEPGLCVHVMPEALTEALTRILANVLDHAFVDANPTASQSAGKMGATGGILHLSARRVNPGEVEINVRDNGCGIADADLPRVFDPFFTTKSGLQGHIGLGLHVAYNHVTQGLGGEIAVRSGLGRGTCVAITIKVADRK